MPPIGHRKNFYFQRIYFYYIKLANLLKFDCYLPISKLKKIVFLSILRKNNGFFRYSHALGSAFKYNFKNDYIDPIPRVQCSFSPIGPYYCVKPPWQRYLENFADF